MNNLRPAAATACHVLLIALLGALIYSNTLTASFQFDDKLNIVDNLFIRDIRNLWPPTGARWFGLLTFSLNYLAGGHNPVGYHLVNICIHILTALSVYLFVLLTFRTPYFKGRREGVIQDDWFAFACALLFVAHPIQTQAVTYIVQRFASLATLLFMLSLDCYILARTAQRKRRHHFSNRQNQELSGAGVPVCCGRNIRPVEPENQGECLYASPGRYHL